LNAIDSFINNTNVVNPKTRSTPLIRVKHGEFDIQGYIEERREIRSTPDAKSNMQHYEFYRVLSISKLNFK
ncbi:hypothetical protein HON22_02660, partial [Candidatus Peregrinibacteria bacterium]|nr:hypothetical protein [Candidatus Peregrinibacteria bacterium]